MAISTETEAEAEVSKALKEGGVTVEHQRKKAKEMVKFFYSSTAGCGGLPGVVDPQERDQQRPMDHVRASRGDDDGVATGVDFIDQIRLTISVMGIADVSIKVDGEGLTRLDGWAARETPGRRRHATEATPCRCFKHLDNIASETRRNENAFGVASRMVLPWRSWRRIHARLHAAHADFSKPRRSWSTTP